MVFLCPKPVTGGEKKVIQTVTECENDQFLTGDEGWEFNAKKW